MAGRLLDAHSGRRTYGVWAVCAETRQEPDRHPAAKGGAGNPDCFKNYNCYLEKNGGNAGATTAPLNAEYPLELSSAINGLSWNRRAIPERFSWVRAPGYMLLDVNLKQEFRLTESKSLSIRVDASNVLNTCNWLNVNAGWTNTTIFGVVGSQNGYPRQLQLWLTFKF